MPLPTGAPAERMYSLILFVLVLVGAAYLLYHSGYLNPAKYDRGRQAYLESFFVLDFKIDSSGNLTLFLTSNLADNVTFAPTAYVAGKPHSLSAAHSSLTLPAGKRGTIVIRSIPVTASQGTWVEINDITVHYHLTRIPGTHSSTGGIRGQIEAA